MNKNENAGFGKGIKEEKESDGTSRVKPGGIGALGCWIIPVGCLGISVLLFMIFMLLAAIGGTRSG